MAFNDINRTKVPGSFPFPRGFSFCTTATQIHTDTNVVPFGSFGPPFFLLLSTTNTLFHVCIEPQHFEHSKAQHIAFSLADYLKLFCQCACLLWRATCERAHVDKPWTNYTSYFSNALFDAVFDV